MKKLMAVFALGFAFAGCGVAPEEEPLPISSMEAALANNGGYTTRDVCKACGCVASDVACDCGTPPSQRKLDCIDNGGPVKKPEAMQLSGGDTTKVPFCLPGEVKHCTLGPPPVCTCIPPTTGVGTFAP
jgi:hypothetical protein